MPLGNTRIIDQPKRSDEWFEKLLLRLSAAAAQSGDLDALIRLFCQSTREFFQVSGTYFWKLVSKEELVGSEADGLMAEAFRGRRLHLTRSSSAVAADCVRQRKTVYVNRLDPGRYAMADEFHARSIMASPLIVSGEVLGAVVFLHDSDPDYFNDDFAAKATIVAGQIGSLGEALRLTHESREEYRRAEILADVANALHAVPDASAVTDAVADRIRVLLRVPLVAVLLKNDTNFVVRSVSAETTALASAGKACLSGRHLQFLEQAARNAVSAGAALDVHLDTSRDGLQGLVSSGILVAAPFRTSSGVGAVILYPRQDGALNDDERSLVSTIAGFGAVAIANAELYGTARGQAQELHQLLEISSELSSAGDFDRFMRHFAERAATFLLFRRSFLALLENDVFHIRWGADEGRAQALELVFPSGSATRALLGKEAFWTDDASAVPEANLSALPEFRVKQMLAVPLLGANGQVLGCFGVLDQESGAKISPEDVRRAKALAAQAAVALEMTRGLHLSEQHRAQAEALMSLALETSYLVRIPDFASRFINKVAQMLGAAGAALAVANDSQLEIAALQGTGSETAVERRHLAAAMKAWAARKPEAISSGQAADLLNGELAAALGWNDVILASLNGASGDLLGILLLASRNCPLSDAPRQLLQAAIAHATVALENARLFARMEHANRHWLEIFDALSDFIVVHDEHDNVLRVNRPLADFIGLEPGQVIGITMGALLATVPEKAARTCPLCHAGAEKRDEFVQSVLERTYLVSTSRIHGSQGENLQTIHVLKDISDRREAERRYRELFDNIQEGLFFTTPDGRFIEVNDALVRMLGYASREELLQAEIPAQIYASPERRHELLQVIDQEGAVRNYQETLRRKDGSTIYVLLNAFAVRDLDGRVLQFRGLMLDITDLKNYQFELQRERDFSSKILNNTQSLILVADTAGLISYANRRWYEAGGYQQHQLVGHPLTELIASSRRASMQDALRATLSGQQVDNLELPILRADGRTGQFSVNLSPMRDDQGHVSSIVVVMSDITDAAMLQAKLVHTEKLAAVGQLVSGVAHEVNNPLTAILGFADLLMENPELPDSAKKDLRVILQEAQRTKQIVQNLLSFARQMPPQRQPLQLNAVLSRTIQLRAYDFASHGVEIVEHFAGDLPAVIGDSHQLQQVFLNILNNAYDAVRETGRAARIEVSTSVKGDAAEVVFRDNGMGIAHPERIFDPFFTTKEVGKGTGLGLSICYGIVREHGGEIYCHNNEGSPGATFVVRLPAIEEAAFLTTIAGALPR